MTRLPHQIPVAFSPGFAADLARLDVPIASGQVTLGEQARIIVARLGEGERLGSEYPAMGNAALAGIRVAYFETPATRAANWGQGALLYQFHPAEDRASGAVVQIVAGAHVTDMSVDRAMRADATKRLNPGDGQLALAYSTGIRRDLEKIGGDQPTAEAILNAVNQLAQPKTTIGGQMLSGEDLSARGGLDLRGYKHVAIRPHLGGGQQLDPVSVVYRLLKPAIQSEALVVQIVAIGPHNDRGTAVEAAMRLRRTTQAKVDQNARQREAQQVPVAPLGRSAAARSTSTNGATPKPAAATPGKPSGAAVRASRKAAEGRRNGL